MSCLCFLVVVIRYLAKKTQGASTSHTRCTVHRLILNLCRGIPYAEPPTGSSRFRPVRPNTLTWSGIKSAQVRPNTLTWSGIKSAQVRRNKTLGQRVHKQVKVEGVTTESQTKKLKKWPCPLFRPRTNQTCHQNQNPSRETVPLILGGGTALPATLSARDVNIYV